MADAAAARREARRQKILASGQDRLNKLTSTFTGRPIEPTATAATSQLNPDEPTIGPSVTSSDLPSTPPLSSSDSQLRQRINASTASTRIHPQSPSVARTPQDEQPNHGKPTIAAHFSGATPATTLPSFPTGDLFGDPDDMMMSELQARLMGNNNAIAAALAPGSGGGAMPGFAQQFSDGVPPPMQRVPVQPAPRWTFLSLFRAAVMLLLALFTLHNLAGVVDDVVDVGSVDADEPAAPEWRLQMRRVAALATTQLGEGGGEIKLGMGGEDGTWVSVWMCFLATELVLQTIGLFSRPPRPAAAANPFDPMSGTAGDILNGGDGDLMSMMAQMASMSSPKLDFAVRSVRDYSAILRSFMDDLLTYTFVLGAGIAVALCFQ
ncbi:hypothetical protein HDU86_004320 [Geranomyces michiganensis]|nr:hypothetical protein HDU86_004320 [Geranomyces michiganensis]